MRAMKPQKEEKLVCSHCSSLQKPTVNAHCEHQIVLSESVERLLTLGDDNAD